MAERFAPDFTKVDANIPIYKKGSYQVLIKKAIPFVFNNKSGDLRVGVRFALEMIGKFDAKGVLDRADEGRPMSQVTLWLHSEKAWGMNKQLLMAAGGYKRDAEDAANKNLFAKHEWDVEGNAGDETEDLVMGSGYSSVVGRAVNVNLDESLYEPDDGPARENQDFRNWAPAA